jgi:hypothetical protein
VTAAALPAAPVAGTAAGTVAGTVAGTGRAAGHRAPAARRFFRTTPTRLRTVLAGLVLLSLAWGALGGWVAASHSSAADTLATVDERYSLDARHLYQAIADADATITAALLASSEPPLNQLARYNQDLATASGDLATLRAAGGSDAGNSQVAGALSKLSGGLADYNGYVADATAEYAMGFPLTGGSFLQVASEEAHLVLLPAASTVYTQENAVLNAASGQATGLPTGLAALLLAVITAVALYRTQRWLARSTKRVLSPGLVLASLLLVVSVLWLATGFLSARGDLDRGIDHGSAPAQSLALASIGVQQIRGDSVLNVISRSGTASFTDDFAATSKRVGPGAGGWLTAAAAGQQAGSGGATSVATAEGAAADWFTANAQLYRLGNYAAERNLVIGGANGSTSAGYNALEFDLSSAIAADQAVFDSAASDGANALDPLAGVLIAASLLMAAGCGWAISRRLAEYR